MCAHPHANLLEEDMVMESEEEKNNKPGLSGTALFTRNFEKGMSY